MKLVVPEEAVRAGVGDASLAARIAVMDITCDLVNEGPMLRSRDVLTSDAKRCGAVEIFGRVVVDVGELRKHVSASFQASVLPTYVLTRPLISITAKCAPG